jgi:DNA-directed RNA polymerase I subunit RPA1
MEAHFALAFPVAVKKLVLVKIVEQAAEEAMVHMAKGINRCFVVELEGVLCLQTEGRNFPRVWGLANDLQLNELMTNDIYGLLESYGVEAARAAISGQVKAVFGVYGICVDPRHLGLLADYMTFDGSYKPLNRAGIEVL